MQERQWSAVDKTDWPAGPWHDEPDKMQWVDETTGLPCLIKRNRLGALCGYVGVPNGHPWYRLNADQIEPEPDVHGDLTYTGHCEDGPDAKTICHIPDQDEPDDVWWVGFDCQHGYDLAPTMPHYSAYRQSQYRTVGYVRDQCTHLAHQVRDAARANP